MEQTLEICRWVYNETLAMRESAWEQEQRSLSYYESKRQIPLWKKEHPELSGVYSQVLQDVSMRVDLAFKAFSRRVKAGENPGYPRFKGKGDTIVSPTLSTGSNSREIVSTSQKLETARSCFIVRSREPSRPARFGGLRPESGMPASRSSMILLLSPRRRRQLGSLSDWNPSPPSRTGRRSKTPGSFAPTRRLLRKRRGDSQKQRRALLERSSHTSTNGSPTDGSILLIRPPTN